MHSPRVQVLPYIPPRKRKAPRLSTETTETERDRLHRETRQCVEIETGKTFSKGSTWRALGTAIGAPRKMVNVYRALDAVRVKHGLMPEVLELMARLAGKGWR